MSITEQHYKLAKICHDAYWRCLKTGVSPDFDEIPDRIRDCWVAAAIAVVSAMNGDDPI